MFDTGDPLSEDIRTYPQASQKEKTGSQRLSP